MKPISSPLKLIDFAVLRMDYDFFPPGDEGNPQSYFDKYELDLDFDMLKNDILHIIMSVDINVVDNPMPGYKISAKVASLFKLEDSPALSPEQRNSIEGFSTIYIALNNLRGIISAFTSSAPFGRYILPSIDLNDLIQKKRKGVKAESTEVAKLPRKRVVGTKKKSKDMKQK
jgi:preprotein translocase subunit SecB